MEEETLQSRGAAERGVRGNEREKDNEHFVTKPKPSFYYSVYFRSARKGGEGEQIFAKMEKK